MNQVTVLIADDEELTRTGLRTLLNAQPGLEVLGEATDGSQVLSLVSRWRPDVVLMDVRMPHVDGIEATRQLVSGLVDPPKVVVITTFDNDDYVYGALRAGASGFLLKRAPARQIAAAIHLVAEAEAVLFPESIRALVATRMVNARQGTPPAGLTARELEVLRSMAAGLSNVTIAERLVISVETVKTHVGNVLTKLGADNRTQAVILAYEWGIVVPRAGLG